MTVCMYKQIIYYLLDSFVSLSVNRLPHSAVTLLPCPQV